MNEKMCRDEKGGIASWRITGSEDVLWDESDGECLLAGLDYIPMQQLPLRLWMERVVCVVNVFVHGVPDFGWWSGAESRIIV